VHRISRPADAGALSRCLNKAAWALGAVALLALTGCATPPFSNERDNVDQEQSAPDNKPDDATPTAKSSPMQDTEQPAIPPWLPEVLGYYTETRLMSTVQSRRQAAQLRASMPPQGCSPERLKLLMLAAQDADLLAKPDQFGAPCRQGDSGPDEPAGAMTAILNDLLTALQQRRNLVDRTESLQQQRKRLRRRKAELEQQLEGLKDIERSLQQN